MIKTDKKRVKSDNFCYRKFGRVMFKWGAIKNLNHLFYPNCIRNIKLFSITPHIVIAFLNFQEQ